ncbi:Metallo-hydrolase/oxidoreductase [Hortaea werneckii]|nr:Metallo-hydrolase/oxidoreductase [Hortaea werneckii]KAI6884966.1 Metallo-hydrolase/oxidoreductase [Hortaea werneckii]KAI6994285.1 Metallo-hydrolase/oxidoreductase [Hortaea werneckii]KAI7190710.1 Metallo-hydrolase/oxidoreductase [Hortaea werneckii]
MATSTSSAPPALPPLPLIQRLSPRVLRLLGDNPSKFTLQGSNTYLVGSGPRRFLIDTGEGGRKAWTEALEKVLREEGITGIEAVLLTHWHPDHVGGVGDVRGVCGQIFGSGGEGVEVEVFKNQSRRGEYGERGIEDGQVFRTAEGETTLRAFYCPGHAVDHMAFVLEEEGAVFTGDNVLGHGTAVFEDLAAYMRSLEGMVGLFGQGVKAGNGTGRAYPGHGEVIEDGKGKVREYIAHRKEREVQILDALKGLATGGSGRAAGQDEGGSDGQSSSSSMDVVKVVYKDYPENLWVPAEGGVVQVLRKLEGEGRVRLLENGDWKLVEGEKSSL